MEGKDIRIIIIGVLFSVQLAFGCPDVLHSDRAYLSLLHHFFHANVFHLAVNCLAVWTLYKKDVRYGVKQMLMAYVIATVSWFCSIEDVVGFSNFIFATIGLRTPSFDNSWWKHPSVITFFVITVLMAFLPNVSAVTHVVSFVLGSITAGAYRIINRISSDFRRASYC